MIKKTLGRDADCDHVIFDPKNRVSRKHAELYYDQSKFFIKDLSSLNGTYINGNKIAPRELIQIGLKDKLTFSVDYVIDLTVVFNISDDSTKILTNNTNQNPIASESNNTIFRDKDRTVVFDRDKTQIGDILQLDNSPFITIGRSTVNDVVINNIKISKHHCKIRLITPVMIEIEDLGSTNGTYADGEKITPNTRFQYSSSVKIRLGNSIDLRLEKIFPQVQIIQKSINPNPEGKVPSPNSNILPTEKEKAAFKELEDIWLEYQQRQNQANNSTMKYSIGGAVLGLAASLLVPGAGSIMAMGGGIFGRYLGQQKSNEIRGDLTFDNIFLQTYACPRCSESFQKKPWITIRNCHYCKTKFR